MMILSNLVCNDLHHILYHHSSCYTGYILLADEWGDDAIMRRNNSAYPVPELPWITTGNSFTVTALVEAPSWDAPTAHTGGDCHPQIIPVPGKKGSAGQMHQFHRSTSTTADWMWGTCSAKNLLREFRITKIPEEHTLKGKAKVIPVTTGALSGTPTLEKWFHQIPGIMS